jgi:SAM-dependent methyltransferase
MLIYEELRRIVGDDDDVLDVGTKDGRHLDGVAGDVYALDLGPDPRLPTVTYVRGDGCALPFNDGSFDYVVSNQVLEHVRDKDRILDEIHRVLRPDGTFLVSFPNRLFPGNPHDLPPFFHSYPVESDNSHRSYSTPNGERTIENTCSTCRLCSRESFSKPGSDR